MLPALLVGCGGGFPKAPAYPHEDPSFSGPQAIQLRGLPDDKPVPLLVQPGDILRLELVSTSTEIRDNILVDGTGRIHLPLVGDIEVQDLGLTQIEAKVQTALRQFDRAMHVNVQISQPSGQQATVLGAVQQPGRVQLVPGARLADVIASAGGTMTLEVAGQPVPAADLGGAVLMRDGRRVPVSIDKAMQGDGLHNVYVHPGDHVYLPPIRNGTISVLGQVGGATAFAYQPNLRLTQALSMAGGVTAGADKADIRVVRGPLEAPQVYQASLRDIVDGESHDVALYPGDVVFVADHPLEDFGEVIAAIAPVVSVSLTAATLALVTTQAERRTSSP